MNTQWGLTPSDDVVPASEDGLRRALGEAHRRYSRRVNFQGWRGHLRHGQFASYVMDEYYLLACVRHAECNMAGGVVALGE